MSKISLKKNIVASYISQAYVALVGIFVLPFYISTMGAEVYGLVGFFTMLQAMFNLLDLGLTPTISRETARYRAGVHSAVFYSQFYRALNLFFSVIAILGGGLLLITANTVAKNWLNVEELSISQVSYSLQVMAITVSLRWMTGLSRGVITGSEQLVWLSGFNVSIATLRFLIVLPVMWRFGATPLVFFVYQLCIAIVEYAVLLLKARSLKPILNSVQKSELVWSIKPVKPYLRFALSIALTSGLWVVVSQTDKLIMSKLLSLEDYGYFTLAVLVASGIMLAGGPVSSSILPRMAKLDAEGDLQQLLKIYKEATQLITVVAGSACIMLFFFSEPILMVWTADQKVVDIASPVLQLYALGYGLIAVGAFPYYLQYSFGKLKLHVVGSILFVAVLLPTLWFATQAYGMVGAGYAWVIVNVLYLLGWSAYVHGTYVPGLHWNWIKDDILKLLPLPILIGWGGSICMIHAGRTIMFVQLCLISVIVVIAAASASEKFKHKLLMRF